MVSTWPVISLIMGICALPIFLDGMYEMWMRAELQLVPWVVRGMCQIGGGAFILYATLAKKTFPIAYDGFVSINISWLVLCCLFGLLIALTIILADGNRLKRWPLTMAAFAGTLVLTLLTMGLQVLA